MKNDIKQYRSHIFFMGLFVFLLHSAKINSVVIGIDTEDLIHSEQNLYGGWLGTGRQGLVFLKYFFESLLIIFVLLFPKRISFMFLTSFTARFYRPQYEQCGRQAGRSRCCGLSSPTFGGIGCWLLSKALTHRCLSGCPDCRSVRRPARWPVL